MKKALLLLLMCFNTLLGFSQIFFEGFENTTGPNPLPSTNWTLGSGSWAVFDNGVSVGERWSASTLAPLDGLNCAYINRGNIGMSNTSEEYLVTPAITLSGICDLSFFSRSTTQGNQGTIYQIKIALADNPANQTDPNAFVLWAEFDESSLTNDTNNYTQKWVSLNGFQGPVFIAFVKKYSQPTSSLGGDRWQIDNVSVYDRCPSSGNCSKALILNAFIDSNGNDTQEVGEADFDFGTYTYQLNNSADIYGYPDNGSYIILDSNTANTYNINFNLNGEIAPYFVSNTSFTNVSTPITGGPTTLNFPITQTATPYTDVKVIMYSWPWTIPGGEHTIEVIFRNMGQAPIPNGTITFTKDPNQTIDSYHFVTPYPDPQPITTTTGCTYDFTNLTPGEVREFRIRTTIGTPPEVNLGDLITYSANVQAANDIFLDNNTFTKTQVVRSSYDPNNISESHGEEIVFNDFAFNDYLYYTIAFENTGTAPAQFIRIEDFLDTKLDPTTYQFLDSSHNVNATRQGDRLSWLFQNINLPPTSSNPDNSHGNVLFRIKPKPGYAVGDIVPSKAYIYFDYNSAIVTPTFNTEFVQTLGNATFNTDAISIYPNPTSESVSISNSNTNDKIATVEIYEISGKIIHTLSNNSLTTININTSLFSKGLYLIELTSDNNLKTTKKLLIK